MSNYDQPATWADVSGAIGNDALIQTSARHLQPREKLLGVFDVELDQLLPLLDPPGEASLHLFRETYRAIRRYFHGGSCNDLEGVAGKVWEAVRRSGSHRLPDHSEFLMVLTERRMLLLSRPNGWKRKEPYEADLLLEFPSGSYALRPNVPFSRFTYRFDLAFNDGSWIALVAAWKDKKHKAESEETLRQITRLLAR